MSDAASWYGQIVSHTLLVKVNSRKVCQVIGGILSPRQACTEAFPRGNRAELRSEKEDISGQELWAPNLP